MAISSPEWAGRYGGVGEPEHPTTSVSKTDTPGSVPQQQSGPLGPLTRYS